MKIFVRLFLIVALALGLSACGKKEAGPLDLGALEKAFATAEAAIKAPADKAVTAARAGDYETLVRELSRLSLNEKLTAEQQNAIKEVLPKAQAIMAAAPPKNINQLPMALPK